MSLKTVRKALKEQLEEDQDLQSMFSTFVEEKKLNPADLDGISVRKIGSEEEKKEFGYGSPIATVYSFEIVCANKCSNIEKGDDAQLLADQYVREAIRSDTTLGQVIDFIKTGKTIWGEDANNDEIYYTVLPVECKLNEDPTDR